MRRLAEEHNPAGGGCLAQVTREAPRHNRDHFCRRTRRKPTRQLTHLQGHHRQVMFLCWPMGGQDAPDWRAGPAGCTVLKGPWSRLDSRATGLSKTCHFSGPRVEEFIEKTAEVRI
jgi:hypothetical protein